MSSRTTLSYLQPHNSLNSSPLNSLQPLCRRQKSQPLWNQANPSSFSKIPGCGVGHPERNYGIPGWGGYPDPVPLHFSSPPCPLCSNLGALCVKPFLAFAGRQAQMVPPTTFRINTCKSVSKQRTLTPFRINTYEKPREGVGDT